MRHTLAIGILGLFILPLSSPAAAGPSARVRIEVRNLDNQKGSLRCAIFASSVGFPEQGGVQATSVALSGHAPLCEFADLAPGTYAVSVHHDENGDGKLNKNLFGAPSEGYGVSNNHTYALSAPKWSESRFELAGAETKILTITLRN